MKKATLPQAVKLLTLFDGVPPEQLQELLESGLLTDLRDGNLGNVNRDEFRRVLGLKPLAPSAPKVRLAHTRDQMEGGEIKLGVMIGATGGWIRPVKAYVYYLNNPDQIPEDWRGNCIYFPETAYAGPDKTTWIRCMVVTRSGHIDHCTAYSVESFVGPNGFVVVPV